MLVSLNWIREFLDLPADLDPQDLAERFTVTCAEVETVEHITAGADGLIAGRIESVAPIANTPNLHHVVLNVGKETVESVSAAPDLAAGQMVVYAPPGTTLKTVGKIDKADVAGHDSVGMIPSGEDLGLEQAADRAIFLPPSTQAGSAIDPGVLDDWIIEIDNKSITHRPDLWGHYGIAREIAAMLRIPLKPYEVVEVGALRVADLPEVPIVIDEPDRCPRYSCLRMENVAAQPAPLWMQSRLSHCGVRPIDLLVDLTNYIMLELGQPMHAFDGGNVDRIEVAPAKKNEKFTTLDGIERTLDAGTIMIQSNRRSVALGGIMGGADTEISAKTKTLLLESANFDGATIRRSAAAMGHRTEASARFEKSLDPANTILAIQRFVQLARPELPDLRITSLLSDAFPSPPETRTITIDHDFLNRFMGKTVSKQEITDILEAIEFKITFRDGHFDVVVPTFRAMRDITIEADVIEEVARFVGYGNIEAELPQATMRHFEPNPAHQLEQRTLKLFCRGLGFNEIHSYIWDDDNWLKKLNFDPGPCIQPQYPAASTATRLRQTLMPTMLAAVELNRHHFDALRLLDLGGAFFPRKDGDTEERHLALALAVNRKKAEDGLFAEMKSVLTAYGRQVLDQPTEFRCAASADLPWEHDQKSADVIIGQTHAGRLTVVPQTFRRTIDEHLTAWSIVLAELDLSALTALKAPVQPLPSIPAHPLKTLDFSFLCKATDRYTDIAADFQSLKHPLLRRISFVDSFEGKNVPEGKRSLTIRAVIGDSARTLTQEDIDGFHMAVLNHLKSHDLEIRG
jgi:phenylalanyl-tRNA synthetase beta chain